MRRKSKNLDPKIAVGLFGIEEFCSVQSRGRVKGDPEIKLVQPKKIWNSIFWWKKCFLLSKDVNMH